MLFLSGLQNLKYFRRDPSRWPRNTLYPQKLTLTSPTRGGRSVGIVHSRTQAMELFFFFYARANLLVRGMRGSVVKALREITGASIEMPGLFFYMFQERHTGEYLCVCVCVCLFVCLFVYVFVCVSGQLLW
jgi:hypothetical protein